MTHQLTRRVLIFIAVVMLLVAMSLAADPIFGRPDTSCMLAPSAFWPSPPECD
jgi:hypothetical protein